MEYFSQYFEYFTMTFPNQPNRQMANLIANSIIGVPFQGGLEEFTER